MDEQRQDDPLEPENNSSVRIQDVALKTSRERWTIETGGGRGSGRSVLVARHDDDDDYTWNHLTVYKPVKLRLKIDLVSYPARAEGLVIKVNRVQTNEGSYSESLVLNSNTWNHLTVYKQMNSGSSKGNVYNKLFVHKLCVCINRIWY